MERYLWEWRGGMCRGASVRATVREGGGPACRRPGEPGRGCALTFRPGPPTARALLGSPIIGVIIVIICNLFFLHLNKQYQSDNVPSHQPGWLEWM